ncbi:hypothetical protein Y032_1118g3630 [Ancylostoma ceylanicum]|uniref:Uncharacterized protein n=1 Tax=Ancylostoma ceylanicum TaxID=53326 RepID=A0A016W6D2_9BILA|nr:hypothetical protein Y032_1118g3630 [Ancylostoma ceylanicum]
MKILEKAAQDSMICTELRENTEMRHSTPSLLRNPGDSNLLMPAHLYQKDGTVGAVRTIYNELNSLSYGPHNRRGTMYVVLEKANEEKEPCCYILYMLMM